MLYNLHSIFCTIRRGAVTHLFEFLLWSWLLMECIAFMINHSYLRNEPKDPKRDRIAIIVKWSLLSIFSPENLCSHILGNNGPSLIRLDDFCLQKMYMLVAFALFKVTFWWFGWMHIYVFQPNAFQFKFKMEIDLLTFNWYSKFII